RWEPPWNPPLPPRKPPKPPIRASAGAAAATAPAARTAAASHCLILLRFRFSSIVSTSSHDCLLPVSPGRYTPGRTKYSAEELRLSEFLSGNVGCADPSPLAQAGCA